MHVVDCATAPPVAAKATSGLIMQAPPPHPNSYLVAITLTWWLRHIPYQVQSRRSPVSLAGFAIQFSYFMIAFIGHVAFYAIFSVVTIWNLIRSETVRVGVCVWVGVGTHCLHPINLQCAKNSPQRRRRTGRPRPSCGPSQCAPSFTSASPSSFTCSCGWPPSCARSTCSWTW